MHHVIKSSLNPEQGNFSLPFMVVNVETMPHCIAVFMYTLLCRAAVT